MATSLMKKVVCVLVLVILATAEATPPGIANNPSHARCLIKKYKMCYNLEHVCPKFCPNSCTVECVSCKPICTDGSTPPPTEKVNPPPNNSPPDHGAGAPPPGNNQGGSGDNGKSPPPREGDNGGHDGKGAPPPKNDHGDGKSPPPSEGDEGTGHAKGTPPSSPPSTPTTPKPSPPVPTPPSPSPSYSPPQSSPTPSPPVSTPPTSPTPPTPVPSAPSSPPSPPSPTPSPSPTPPTQVPSAPSSPSSPPSPILSPPLSVSPSPTPPTPVPSTPSPLSVPPPPVPSTPSSPPSPPLTTPSISPTPSTQPSSTPTPPSSPAPIPPSAPSSNTPPPAPYWPPQSPGNSSEASGARRKRCKNKNYPQCYGLEHICPSSCPNRCEVDCVTCKPVCKCDMPGAVCQDPRFIGGDGITFYFHGKKDKDFCLVTEPDFQINAHFIGKRNENMKRDFTWVQSIGILFGDHQLFVGAQKTPAWNDAVDRLSLAFDGEPIMVSTVEGFTWQSASLPIATIRRDSDTNSVIVVVDGLFKISAKVVPITQQESKVHNYGITDDDCFSHLELGFKFFSLSGNVNGVLGQTYRDNYVSRVKMGVAMPVLGGENEFSVSNIFAADCAVSQFQAGKLLQENDQVSALGPPSMKCGGGIDGRGVVCKK